MSEQFAKKYTKKKYMIRSYANELEHDGKMDLHDTSKHITQVLKGYITCMYIQKFGREIRKRICSSKAN